ncbi:MAG: hypothetical protein LBN33_00025 [Desulfovibrio sp.]|jgi:hypothetical protein|nr:hypothetical protein [Desulfovibrio sp.]
MWTFLFGAVVVVLCIAAMRIAKPEYYSPRCCSGLAHQIIQEYKAKEKAEKEKAEKEKAAEKQTG